MKSILASALLLAGMCDAVLAADTPWMVLESDRAGKPILEYRTQAEGAPRKYLAVRAALDYFQLRLISSARLAGDRPSDWVADLPTLRQSWLELQPADTNMVAIAPAGFPASIGSIVNVGLLRTDGIEDVEFQPKGPTAVLCLHSSNPIFAGYDYQVPAFYRPDEISGHLNSANKCKDAIQAGPRILEDPKVPGAGLSTKVFTGPDGDIVVRLGISESEAGKTPYKRTVFAVDTPNDRPETDDHQFGGRNAYLIVFTDEVNLYDVQTLLVSPEFYGNPRYYPGWAINLVGGVYAGMIVPGLKNVAPSESTLDSGQVGSVDNPLSSAIALVRRTDRP
jgi:hypothetical protein